MSEALSTGARACVVAVLLTSAVIGGCGASQRQAPSRGPESLLLITLDTTRRDFISPYGADPRLTPNLQELADSGTLFWNAYAQANNTNPAHLTIATGLTLRQHGVFNNRLRLPEDVDTLPEAFSRAGFETAAFPSAPHVGEDFGWRGFDRLVPARRQIDARAATDRILDWLASRDTSRRFFAWLHYWDPHAIYLPPAKIQELFYDGDPYAGSELLAERPHFERRKLGEKMRRWLGRRRDPEWPRAMYAGEVHYMDRELGRLMAYLDRSGLAERTAVFVIADHGESLGEHGIFYGHAGLYETQLHIPFMVRVPGFPGGSRPENLVSQVDVAPTIAELFGVSLRHAVPGEPTGVSLVPWLTDAASARSARTRLVSEHADNLEVAHRRGRWKLIFSVAEDPVLPSRPRLYDLEADPREEHDLSTQRPDILEQLEKGLDPWISLGRVWASERAPIEVSPEAIERLRALGYVD